MDILLKLDFLHCISSSREKMNVPLGFPLGLAKEQTTTA